MKSSLNGEMLANLMSEKMNSPTFHQVFYKKASNKENEFSSKEVLSLILRYSEKLENLGLTKTAIKLIEAGEIFAQEIIK